MKIIEITSKNLTTLGIYDMDINSLINAIELILSIKEQLISSTTRLTHYYEHINRIHNDIQKIINPEFLDQTDPDIIMYTKILSKYEHEISSLLQNIK